MPEVMVWVAFGHEDNVLIAEIVLTGDKVLTVEDGRLGSQKATGKKVTLGKFLGLASTPEALRPFLESSVGPRTNVYIIPANQGR